MKKKIINTVIILMIFVGISVLLYPSVSDWWNARAQEKVIEEYVSAMDEMSSEENIARLEEAHEYNQRLFRERGCHLDTAAPLSDYMDMLNIDNTGVMGFITIDRIQVQLPVYHGTEELILQSAAGHLEGSSLPVGGESTHCVISGHTGLPSSKLFTYLDKLEKGDTFTLTVMNEVLTYRVDQILVVKPDELEALDIVEGKDYCTLLTCTPYGINTHRLLVRGERIETPETMHINVSADAYRINPIITAVFVALLMLLIFLIYVLVRYRKKKN